MPYDRQMRVYHYLEAKWALDNIRRRRLKLSKIDDMNDPYEWNCVHVDNKSSHLALDRTRTYAVENHGALCFSRSWNNILMWSHYGERHKGICLGFDVPDENTQEVKYVDDVFVVGNLDDVPVEERRKILHHLYWTKYRGWCYKEEVRLNASRDEIDEETGKYFVSFSEQLKLKEVIAGVRFPMSRGPIENALRGYSEDVKIVKAGRSAKKFEIIIDYHGFDRGVERLGAALQRP
jgi:hypothetical protein